MKRKVVKQGERPKAFIGALIGAVAGIAGSIISSSKKKKSEQLTLQAQQDEDARAQGVQQAAALTSSYANQDYVDQYQNKVTLKGGGKMKISKNDLSDRVNRDKKFSVGARNKYKSGGKKKGLFGLSDTDTSSAITTVGNVVSSNINKASGTTPLIDTSTTSNLQNILNNRKAAANALANKTKTTITPNSNLDVQPINTNIMKNGGKKVIKRKDIDKDGDSTGKDMDRDKAGFGSILGTVTGVGSLVSAIAMKSKAGPINKKPDGFTYEAPKTGLVQNSYQLDANGNPITDINNSNNIDPNNAGVPTYTDRIQQAKMGKRANVKAVIKRK